MTLLPTGTRPYLRQKGRLDLQALRSFAGRNHVERALRELEEHAKDLSEA